MASRKLIFMLSIILTSISLYADIELGSISSLIYEYYDEPNLVYDDNGDKISHKAISKGLISLTPQFIWKQGRNLLLLNIELLGSLGSLDGSFAKDGKLEGQLKADSFYKGYYKESPGYIKFGKYPADLPHGFGTEVTSGQAQVGLELDGTTLFYSLLFYNWFNMLEDDGSYTYIDDKYSDENRVIQILSLNLKIDSHDLGLRFPINSNKSDLFQSIYPSISYKFNKSFILVDSFIGLAYRANDYTFAFREELTFSYYNFNTSLLLAHLTANRDITKSYIYTSIDNKNMNFHYGSHFNYLYQTAGNIYGLNSIGMKQSYKKSNFELYVSSSAHLSTKLIEEESREDVFIGTIFSTGIKVFNIWSDNTLFEIYASLFKPEGFSVINGKQNRDFGFQLVVKLQHIIF